jgi:hypothetical protein
VNIVFALRVTSNRYPDQHNCRNFWPRQSRPESLRLLFVGILEGGVPTETIQWILDNRNACWVVQRGWGRLVLPCHLKCVDNFKRLLEEMVAHQAHLHRCESTMYEV